MRAEQLFNRIRHFRAIATRFDTLDANDLASLKLVAMRLWIIAL